MPYGADPGAQRPVERAGMVSNSPVLKQSAHRNVEMRTGSRLLTAVDRALVKI